MEKFGEAPKNNWAGQGDVVAAAIGEEALQNAAKLAGDLELEPTKDEAEKILRESNLSADHFAPSPEVQKTAAEVLASNPEDNIYLVEKHPGRLGLSSVETTVPIAAASYGHTPPAQTGDRRFDHVGKNFTPPVVPPTPRKAYVPPPQPKSLLKRLFGG